MNLPIKHDLSVEYFLNKSSIESIRNELTLKIESNDNLTEDQKENALGEMDLLLRYEKYRRMLRMIYQLRDERRDRFNNMCDQIRLRREYLTKKRQEFKHELLLNRKDTILHIAKADAELRKLNPESKNRKITMHANDELNKIRLKGRLRRAIQEENEKELRSRVFQKAQFLQKVRKHFPDLEEELMDEYDRQMYDSGRDNN